jgi:hypothetical protein
MQISHTLPVIVFVKEANMRAWIEDRNLARVLRHQGYSYSEIRNRISVGIGSFVLEAEGLARWIARIPWHQWRRTSEPAGY